MTRLRDVVIAGHTGDLATARAALSNNDPQVRVAALGGRRETRRAD